MQLFFFIIIDSKPFISYHFMFTTYLFLKFEGKHSKLLGKKILIKKIVQL